MQIKTSIDELNEFFNKMAKLTAVIVENDFINEEGLDLRATKEFYEAHELLIKIGMRDTGITDIHREIARRNLRKAGRIIK